MRAPLESPQGPRPRAAAVAGAVSAAPAGAIVVGGGVVGCAVALALARRGAEPLLLEAEPQLGLGASGANSGILHTGFDSHPGELETTLILRAAQMRAELLGALGVDVRACGARLAPNGAGEREKVAALALGACGNGVQARLLEDGSLLVPGESVTDPVAFTLALAGAARRLGGGVETGARVCAIARGAEAVALELAGGGRVASRLLVNCAGLFADEVARMAGDEVAEVYPRKGEFLVFSPPAGGELGEILLPVPSPAGKGVLVFPTLDGHVVAGPTARDREDKRDWSVEADAPALIMEKALRAHPPLEGAELVDTYAGLRPAGRGANYVIERSRALPGVVHVAAIRSTGLSASLAIGEHVAAMLCEDGLLSARRAPVPPAPPAGAREAGPWWRRGADHHARPAADGAREHR